MTAAIIVCVIAIAAAAFILFLYDTQKKQRQMLLATLVCMCEKPFSEITDSDIANAMAHDERETLEMVDARMRQTSAAEALKTQAELHALQNQINPHFLYNTLEIIRSRALLGGNKDAAEMAEALALQFRYCINRQGEMASLERELENIHNYLLIQHYRYGKRFTFKEEISESAKAVMGAQLPVMTLQPLIENALVHGINPKIGGGEVILRINAIGERLYIEIEDDGVGIEEEELRKIRNRLHSNLPPAPRSAQGGRSAGIALDNVNQRIRQRFGNEYGIDMVSTYTVGTTVTLCVPLEMRGGGKS